MNKSCVLAFCLLILVFAPKVSRAEAPAVSPTVEQQSDRYIHLEPIIVNIKGAVPNKPSFARLDVVLLPRAIPQCETPTYRKDILGDVPVIVDRINQYMGGITLEKVESIEGVNGIKKDITAIVQQVIGAEKLGEVLIQKILVQ